MQEGKLSCAPSRTHVSSCSGSKLSVYWEINDMVAVTVRRQSQRECLGQTRVSEFWRLNKKDVVEENCMKSFAGYFTRIM